MNGARTTVAAASSLTAVSVLAAHANARSLLAVTSVVVSLLATACGSVERPADWHEHMPPPPGAFAAPGPFDAMAIDGIWGVGDQVVYAIDVDDAGKHHGFTFTLSTTQLPRSKPEVGGITHPVHGRILTYSSIEQWQFDDICYEGRGKAKVRAELRGDDGSSCSGEFEAELFAHWFVDDMRIGMTAGVYQLFAALLRLDCMHATLLRVIRKPSAWSVVSSLGRISIGLQWQPIDHVVFTDEATPFGVLPTAWLPFAITANDQPALDGRMQFTWKRPPMLLSAGVLQIEAWHPDDPARRITVRLASARRGTPPDAPDPDDLGHGVRRGMTVADVLAARRGTHTILHARGTLADGRAVELLEFKVPYTLLFGVLHEGRLIFSSAGDELSLDFLQRRGFTADARCDR